MVNDESVTRFFSPDAAQGAPEPAAELVVVEGVEPGIRVRLSRPVTSLGRRPDNTLVLNSSSVSKYHGRVCREGEGFFVEDLGSTNGILVNGRKLDAEEQHFLCHGDILQLSDQKLIFNNPQPLVNDKGLSTISFDISKVRAEAEELLKDLPGFDQLRKPDGD